MKMSTMEVMKKEWEEGCRDQSQPGTPSRPENAKANESGSEKRKKRKRKGDTQI